MHPIQIHQAFLVGVRKVTLQFNQRNFPPLAQGFFAPVLILLCIDFLDLLVFFKYFLAIVLILKDLHTDLGGLHEHRTLSLWSFLQYQRQRWLLRSLVDFKIMCHWEVRNFMFSPKTHVSWHARHAWQLIVSPWQPQVQFKTWGWPRPVPTFILGIVWNIGLFGASAINQVIAATSPRQCWFQFQT